MRKLLLVISVVLCVTTTAVTQTQFATLSGRVSDPNGAAMPGVNITITSISTKAQQTAVSNHEGLYVLGNVVAGDYELTATKTGFRTSKLRVTVEVAQRLNADLVMEVGQIDEVVDVTDDFQAINTVSGELSRTVSEREILTLPLLTRNPYALVGLAAGASDTGQVTGDTRGLGVTVNGQRTSSINFMLDGGENNDTFVAGVGQVVPLDAVQEFRVQTNNMTAEFGRNAIVTNVITKSGSNSFHGSAYEFYRGAGLSSATFDDNARGIPKSNFVRNQFGGSLGGPIKRDQTFFFGSFEGLRVRSAGTVNYFVPTQDFFNAASDETRNFLTAFGGLPSATGIGLTAQEIVEGIEGGGPYAANPLLDARTGAPLPAGTVLFRETTLSAPVDAGGGLPQNTYLFTGRIDHRFSERTSLLGRYAFQDSNFFAGSISLSPYEGFNTGAVARNQNLNLTLTHSFSPTLFSESRLIYNRIFQNQPLGEAPAETPCWNYDLNVNTPNGTQIVFPGYVPNVCVFAGIPFGGPQNIYQAFQGLTWSRGKHTLKFGGQVMHMRDNRAFGAFQNGFYDTLTMQGMLDGQVDIILVAIDPKGKVPGDVYDPSVDGPFQFPRFDRHFRYNEFAVYAEDTFKVHPRLTLTMGLRYEYFGVLHSGPAHERFLDANLYLNAVGTAENKSIFEQVRDARFSRTNQLYRPDYNDFAPRVGFAWDVFGTGRTVLRGGYGVFYDRNFGNAVFNAIQNPPNYATITLVPLGSFGVENAPINPNQFETLNALGSTLTIASSARMLDNDLRTAYSTQWNATFEHDLFNSGIIGSVSYVGANGYKLYSLNNLNQIGSCLLAPGINSVCDPASTAQGARLSRLNQTRLTGMNRRGNEGLSRYQGISFEMRMRRLAATGLSLNTAYTYSRAEDNSSSFFGDSPFEAFFGFGFRDPYNPALDRAPSTNDIRHRYTVSGVWDVPFARNFQGVSRQVLHGWALTGIFAAQSGGTFTVYDSGPGTCNNSVTNFCHPILTGPIPSRTDTPQTNNPNSFVLYNVGNTFQTVNDFCGGDLACTGRVYNLEAARLSPRNLFRTPGYWNADFAVLKNFPIDVFREGMNLQFRAEFFNIFNHSNLYVQPGTNQFSGANSQVIGSRGVPPAFAIGLGSKERRNIQLAVRLQF